MAVACVTARLLVSLPGGQMISQVAMPRAGSLERARWIDLLRVVAVLLVIFEHAVLLTPLPLPPALVSISNVFAPFRIAALMFLSGLLLPKSLEKSSGEYFTGKARHILWPYLIWTLLIWGLANWGDDRPNLLIELFVNPTTTPMWFLAYLTVYYALAFAIPAAITAYLAPVLVAIAALPEMPDNLQRFLYLFAFFLVGSFVARNWDRLQPFLFRRAVTAISLTLGVGLAVASFLGAPIKYEPLYAVPVLASIVAVLPLVERVSSTRGGKFLAGYGRETIVLFVVHWPVQVYTWNLLARLGVASAEILFVGNLVAGLFVAFLLVELNRRFPIVRAMFAFPGRPGRRSGKSAFTRARAR